jgi:hypothetical protein
MFHFSTNSVLFSLFVNNHTGKASYRTVQYRTGYLRCNATTTRERRWINLGGEYVYIDLIIIVIGKITFFSSLFQKTRIWHQDQAIQRKSKETHIFTRISSSYPFFLLKRDFTIVIHSFYPNHA